MTLIDDIVKQIENGEVQPEEAVKRVERPYKHISEIPFRDAPRAMQTGLGSLDLFAPFKEKRGELVVIGARPGMGKSALMFQIASYVANSKSVLIFSFEMDGEDVLSRIFSHLSNTPSYKFKFMPEKVKKKAKEQLDLMNLKVYAGPRLSVTEIENIVMRAHREDPLGLVVVDYLGLIKLPGNGAKHEEIGEVTKELCKIAKKIQSPVFVATQLNRQVDSRGKGKTPGDSNYKPMMSDIKDSGDVEADADVIMFLSRQSQYDGSRQGEADVEIFKNRAGKTGSVILKFNAELTQFIDPEGETI
jgi:replicative DNA helicase